MKTKKQIVNKINSLKCDRGKFLTKARRAQTISKYNYWLNRSNEKQKEISILRWVLMDYYK